MNLKKKSSIALTAVIVTALLGAFFLGSYAANKNLMFSGSTDNSLSASFGTGNTPSVKADATVYVTKTLPSGEIQFVGSMTKLGINCSFGKLTGVAASYNMTQYNYNITSISIGDQGTLNTDSTVLPGEWNRTAATAHDAAYNTCNFTAVFHPDTGPYTADCIGLNIGPVTIGLTYTLLCYDTFTQVTGIDTTFTITVEYRLYSTSA
jgi:hypothetical protein